MAHSADPVRAFDVVLAAGFADSALADFTEGSSVHDSAKLGPTPPARPSWIRGPQCGRGSCPAIGGHFEGALLFQHGELGFEAARIKREKKRNLNLGHKNQTCMFLFDTMN